MFDARVYLYEKYIITYIISFFFIISYFVTIYLETLKHTRANIKDARACAPLIVRVRCPTYALRLVDELPATAVAFWSEGAAAAA